MRFHYCPDCGAALGARELGDEGLVPWCGRCQKPLFDVFSTCIIALVVNEYGEAALLRQGELSDRFATLVSGYIKPGENAEYTARREILEETGLAVQSLELAGTYWFGRKDMLMVGFIARAQRREFRLSGEIQGAEWVPAAKALELVHPKGSVSYALLERYLAENTPAAAPPAQRPGPKAPGADPKQGEGEPCLN